MIDSVDHPTVRVVTFPNQDGHKLFGALHVPSRPRSDLAVVLLSAGVKGRVGPHGLYRHIAEALSQSGIPVLRFDFHGLGDSEGAINEPLLADYYGSVSMGRYIVDTHVAVEWICRELDVKRVLLAGLCGGAITGLLAGANHSKVAGLIGLGLPVTVDGSNVDKVRFMSVSQLENIRDSYIGKLRDPRSWVRVFALKTNFRLVARSFFGTRRAAPVVSGPAAADPAREDNTNPYFFPALLKSVGLGKPVLLVFSEADRLFWDFTERFVDSGLLRIDTLADRLEVQVVAGANHVFGFKEWQLEMLAKVRGWIDKRFPEPEAPN